jgi:hypothetical protein
VGDASAPPLSWFGFRNSQASLSAASGKISGFTLTPKNRCCALLAHATSLRTDDEEATMSLQFPDLHTIWSWIFHVPDTYEMLWWVLLCVCWFGFVIERRLKSIQQQLAVTAAKDAEGR